MAEWFAELFDERYLAFYEGLDDPVVAEADVDFVDRALALWTFRIPSRSRAAG
jgi:hypothetical protein